MVLPLVAFPFASESQVPTLRSTPSWQAQATSHAGCRSARNQVVGASPAVVIRPRFWTSSITFRHFISGPLQSSSCLSPDLVVPGLFLLSSRPCLLDKAAEGGFRACSCKPAPRGRPSSVEQLRTSSAFSAVCRARGTL